MSEEVVFRPIFIPFPGLLPGNFLCRNMADEDRSLEDFFAKKKAKKGRGKGKFTTSDAITKQVGTGAQKEKDKQKEQASKKSSAVSQAPAKKVI